MLQFTVFIYIYLISYHIDHLLMFCSSYFYNVGWALNFIAYVAIIEQCMLYCSSIHILLNIKIVSGDAIHQILWEWTLKFREFAFYSQIYNLFYWPLWNEWNHQLTYCELVVLSFVSILSSRNCMAVEISESWQDTFRKWFLELLRQHINSIHLIILHSTYHVLPTWLYTHFQLKTHAEEAT